MVLKWEEEEEEEVKKEEELEGICYPGRYRKKRWGRGRACEFIDGEKKTKEERTRKLWLLSVKKKR